MDKIVELKFVNNEVNEAEIAICSLGSVPFIMMLYGSHYAGDDYSVYVNGRLVGQDLNGEYEPLTIDISQNTPLLT